MEERGTRWNNFWNNWKWVLKANGSKYCGHSCGYEPLENEAWGDIGNIGKKIKITKGDNSIEHTAVYPDELVRRIIELCTKSGDLVLDPFAGSGTTLSTANKLGRKWIGYELNKNYNQLIKWRLKSDLIK